MLDAGPSDTPAVQPTWFLSSYLFERRQKPTRLATSLANSSFPSKNVIPESDFGLHRVCHIRLSCCASPRQQGVCAKTASGANSYHDAHISFHISPVDDIDIVLLANAKS
jgi:hypothetical protein